MFEIIIDSNLERAQLVFPYHKEFIDDMKSLISGYERSYDPETKDWWIDRERVDDVISLAVDHFDDVWKIVEVDKETVRTHVTKGWVEKQPFLFEKGGTE